MLNGHLPEFTQSMVKLSDAHDVGTLYRKKVVNGQLVSRTGLDLIGALLGHIIKWILGKTTSENDRLMKDLFAEAKEHFESSSTSEASDIQATTKITPYALKVSDYVLKQLKGAEAINVTEFNTIESELKKHIRKIPNNLKDLIEDDDWKEIPSIYEVLKLCDELKKRSPRLSDDQIALMKRCVHLNKKIHETRKLIKKNSKYQEFFNIEEFNAIQEVSTRLVQSSIRLHKRFRSQYGKVEMIDGALNPTKKQLLGAFKMAKQIPIVNHLTDPQLMVVSSRLIQTILVGPQRVKEIPFPDDCHSFEYQELNTQAEKAKIPVNFDQFDSFLEYHIRSQNRSLGLVLKKEGIVSDISFNLGKEVVEKCFTKPADEESLKTLNTLLAKTLSIGDFEDLQAKVFKRSSLDYTANFINDNLSRKGLFLKLGDQTFELAETKDREIFFELGRDSFYNHLLENPDKIDELIEQNEWLNESVQFPNDLTKEKFLEYLKEANAEANARCEESILEQVAEMTCFTDEQIKNLAEKSHNSKEEIEPLLRLKMLQLMTVCNQSAMGINTNAIDPGIKEQIENRLNTKLQLSCTLKQSVTTISPSLDGFQNRTRYHISFVTDLTNIEFSEQLLPIGSFDKVLDIEALAPPATDSHTFGTFAEYDHVGISPLIVPKLDDLTKAITEQKVKE